MEAVAIFSLEYCSFFNVELNSHYEGNGKCHRKYRWPVPVW